MQRYEEERKTGLLRWPPGKQELATWTFSSNCFYKPHLLAKVSSTILPHFYLCPGLFTQATGGILFVVWILTSRVSALLSEPGDPRHVTHDCPQLNYSQVGAQQLVAQISSPQCSFCLWKVNLQHFFFLSFHCHLCLHEYPLKLLILFLEWVFNNPKLCAQTMQPTARVHEGLDASLNHFLQS